MFRLFLFLSLSSAHTSGMKHEFIEIQSTTDLSQFKAERPGEYDSAATVVYKIGNDVIKIRSIDLKGKPEKNMQQVFNKNIMQYSLLFQDRVSPYTGEVTMNTECVDKNSTRHKIVTTAESVKTFFETMATANLIYGKCDGEKTGFHSKYFLVLCKKKSVLYDVRLFSKESKNLKTVDVKCLK